MSDNWIINNLNHAFQIWNEKLLEIWQIVSQSPADFKGGGIWQIILTINDGIKAVGYALLVLFFAMSIFSNTISLKEFRNWQVGFRYFLRFVAAKAAVTYGLDIMTGIFAICGGVVNRITAQMGGISQALVSLPQELEGSIEGVGFLNSIATDEAVKLVNKQMLSIDTDRARFQNKQNRAGNFTAHLPYEMEQAQAEAKEFLDDLTTRDQRMMFGYVTLAHLADSLEKLDSDTEQIISVGRKNLCQFAPLKYRQEDGLYTVLPFGPMRLHKREMRTLTTESAAVLMPFKVQEILDKGGVYYGQNAISRNLIVCNRKELLNGNGFILGVSGSGKSFAAKQEIAIIILNTDDDVICIDPEREYSSLIRSMNGVVIDISATSKNHINALDINREYGDGDSPVILKSEFVLSLCEQLLGTGKLGAREKSIIDRCTAIIYRDYVRSYEGQPPTLQDFYRELLNQPEPEASGIALAIELFTSGSLNVFAHQTNVDMSSRVICYDLLDLGKQLKSVGMLVMLDAILNRVTQNRQRGKRTHIFIDEMHLFFANDYSAQFLGEAWKRFRKYGALATGITQNIEDILRSPMARTMLANSEFLQLLNQAATDRAELAKLLNISDTQLSYITNAEAGQGLIKVGGNLVPFVNDFPRDTTLYRLMSTRPGEG